MSTPQSTSSGPPGLSVPQTQPTQPTQSTPHQNIPRYSPSEEASLVAESDKLKQSANKLFTVSDFTSAITGYEKALAPLPSYLDFEIAVLRSNIAACFLKLEEWKNCIDEADKGLERLVDYEKTEGEVEEAESKEERIVEVGDDEDVQEGLVVELKRARRRGKDEVQRIRIKLLLRRAKARTETGGWAPLQGALEDYKTLDSFSSLTSLDRKTVQTGLRNIPPKLEVAKQQEMGEMMGKLKQLGNGILKPFGLSTDSFNMVKDEKTGGYNMSFNQNT